MNKTIKILTIYFCFLGFAKASDLNEQNSNIGKIISPVNIAVTGQDPDRIIGIKSVEQRDGNFSDVYFVLERLTDETKNKWRLYTAY